MIFRICVGFGLYRSGAIATCGSIAQLLYHVRRLVDSVVHDQSGLMQSLFSRGVWGGFASPNDSFWWLWCGKAAPQPPEKRVCEELRPSRSQLRNVARANANLH